MPAYDRKCLACDELFTVYCSYEDKNSPKECPHCSSVDGTYMMSAPMFMGRSDRLMGKKDTGFKQVLDKIAERNPRTSVAERK